MENFELESLAHPVGGLSALIPGVAEDLKDVGILAGGAAAGLAAGYMVTKYVIPRIPYVKDHAADPKWAAGINIALGAAGGILLGRFVHRGLGAGVAAGLAGVGLYNLVQSFLPNTLPALHGLGANDELLLGVGSVTDYETMPGMNGVSDYEPIPGQVGGLETFIQ